MLSRFVDGVQVELEGTASAVAADTEVRTSAAGQAARDTGRDAEAVKSASLDLVLAAQ